MSAEVPTVESVAMVLSQNEDSCGRMGESTQFLRVETFDAGGGPYLVISTERWAIESPAEFAAQIQRALEMAGSALSPAPSVRGEA